MRWQRQGEEQVAGDTSSLPGCPDGCRGPVLRDAPLPSNSCLYAPWREPLLPCPSPWKHLFLALPLLSPTLWNPGAAPVVSLQNLWSGLCAEQVSPASDTGERSVWESQTPSHLLPQEHTMEQQKITSAPPARSPTQGHHRQGTRGNRCPQSHKLLSTLTPICSLEPVGSV